MADIRQARTALVRRILEGDGKAPLSERRGAFNNRDLSGPLGTLVGKVAVYPHRVIDGDIKAVRASGLSEDQIFEIVVCAAIGQGNRQYEAAFAALEAASEKG